MPSELNVSSRVLCIYEAIRYNNNENRSGDRH